MNFFLLKESLPEKNFKPTPPNLPEKKSPPPPLVKFAKRHISRPLSIYLHRNKRGSFQSRLILKELYNRAASRIRISAAGMPASATLFHVVCTSSETWGEGAIPQPGIWVFGDFGNSKLGSIPTVKHLSLSHSFTSLRR